MEAAIIPKYGQDYTNETSSNGQLHLNIMVCFKSNQNRIEYVQVYFECQSIPSCSKMSNFMKKMILFGLRQKAGSKNDTKISPFGPKCIRHTYYRCFCMISCAITSKVRKEDPMTKRRRKTTASY